MTIDLHWDCEPGSPLMCPDCSAIYRVSLAETGCHGDNAGTSVRGHGENRGGPFPRVISDFASFEKFTPAAAMRHLVRSIPTMSSDHEDVKAATEVLESAVLRAASILRQLRGHGPTPWKCLGCTPHSAHGQGPCLELDRWGGLCDCTTPTVRQSSSGAQAPRPKPAARLCECGHVLTGHKPECYHRDASGAYDCDCTKGREVKDRRTA